MIMSYKLRMLGAPSLREATNKMQQRVAQRGKEGAGWLGTEGAVPGGYYIYVRRSVGRAEKATRLLPARKRMYHTRAVDLMSFFAGCWGES